MECQRELQWMVTHDVTTLVRYLEEEDVVTESSQQSLVVLNGGQRVVRYYRSRQRW